MIYLIWGKDQFNIQLELNKILKVHHDAQLEKPKDIATKDYINEILTDSFFDNQRVIVAHELLIQVNKEKSEKELIGALGKITESTIPIFIENAEPKGALKKYLTQNATIKHLDKPQGRDLIDHIKKRSADFGGEISPLAAERLASYVGPDYWQLEEELKKLSLYKKDDPLDQTIEVADIDELVKASFEANIFELMDAISQKNSARSITLLDLFLDSGENEIYILTMIARQFRNIAMAKIDNLSEAELAKKAGIHPYVAKKSIAQARNFSLEEIANTYGRIAQADFSLKSGHQPKKALQSIFLN